MKFANLRIWRPPTHYLSNCYFCMVDPTKRHTDKNAPQIQTFLLPLLQYYTAPSSQFPLPQRGISHLQQTAASQTVRKILEIQIKVSQMWLRREGHTSLTRKTLTIWSETLVLPSPMLSVQAQAVKPVGWKRASHRETFTQHFPTSSVGKMVCASATTWLVYSRL